MFRVDYLGDSNEVKGKSTPEGFRVTPSEALEIAKKQRGLKKTVDDFYFDEQYYYVCDGYNGSRPQTAIDSGLNIDGATGEIFDRKTETWLPDPRTEVSSINMSN